MHNTPDYRGVFLRGLGGNSASLGVTQGDAIRNITGNFNATDNNSWNINANGVFYGQTIGSGDQGNEGGEYKKYYFDASRVGRLIMFKECLNNGIVPFIIDNEHKLFYYRGLREYDKEKGYLIDTCKSAQDKYRIYCDRLISKEIDITLDKFIKICINKNYSNLKVLNECLKNNFIEFKDKTRMEKQKIVKDKIKNIPKNEKDLSR